MWYATVRLKGKALARLPGTRCMATRPCDGCGRKVSIAGGIGAIWSRSQDPTEGIILELADGTEHFLCYDCIDQLPDDRDVTAGDVAALPGAE